VRIIIGGMGGMMDKENIVKKAVLEYANILAEKKVNVVLKGNDEAKQIYDSYKIDYINQGISCEEAGTKARNRFIYDVSRDIRKRIMHNVKNNYGAGKQFSLYNYNYIQVNEFLNFIEGDVLQSEVNLLRIDRAIGESKPNQKIFKYFNGSKIKYSYRDFFYYIMTNKNIYSGHLDINYDDVYEEASNDYAYIVENLQKIIQADISNKLKLKNGLYYLASIISDVSMEQDNFFCYIKCEMIWNAMIYLIIEMAKDKSMQNIIEDSLKIIQNDYQAVIQNNKAEKLYNNIFEDYAMLWLLNSEANRDNFICKVLDTLYENSLVVNKVRITKQQKEKVMLISTWLNDNTDLKIDINNEDLLKNILYEIYYSDNEIDIEIDEKTTKYHIVSSINKILEGKQYNDDEILVTEIIRKALMYHLEGEEYYRFINITRRNIYKIHDVLYESVNNSEMDYTNIAVSMDNILKKMARS